jgi:hypothetical protein
MPRVRPALSLPGSCFKPIFHPSNRTPSSPARGFACVVLLLTYVSLKVPVLLFPLLHATNPCVRVGG